MLLIHPLPHRTEQDWLIAFVYQYKEIRISFVEMRCGGIACLVSSFVFKCPAKKLTKSEPVANLRNRNECALQKEINMSVAVGPHWDSFIRTFVPVHVFNGLIYNNEYDNSPRLIFFRNVKNS